MIRYAHGVSILFVPLAKMQKLLGYAAGGMIMAVIAAIWSISHRTPWPSPDAARTEALCVEQISPSLPGSESFRQKADCAKAAGNELDAVGISPHRQIV